MSLKDEKNPVNEPKNEADCGCAQPKSTEADIKGTVSPDEAKKQAPASETPSPVEELASKLHETEEKYKRVLAEYQNFRARSQKERESLYLDNVASTALGFLPVIDTLERAMAHESNEEFKKSLGLVVKQCSESLDRFGIKPFAERGDSFDPHLHDAVMHTEDDELGSGVIAEVLLKGYILGDRVVRHAMVKVAN
ncbi:MAG: nucleotide exchange factor GrpE [Clostridiaceae bacterium]|nr:nucleotide exchange factor GrpE [Clostridiaceae bacterium]